jgi:RNA polymerase sigma factor (sigma-70 family)
VLVNAHLDDQRRAYVRREVAHAEVPDVVVEGVEPTSSDAAVFQALAALPPRARAAVVLRHVFDVSVAETAAVLGCSEGTVKSQTARGLGLLRTALTGNATV